VCGDVSFPVAGEGNRAVIANDVVPLRKDEGWGDGAVPPPWLHADTAHACSEETEAHLSREMVTGSFRSLLTEHLAPAPCCLAEQVWC